MNMAEGIFKQPLQQSRMTSNRVVNGAANMRDSPKVSLGRKDLMATFRQSKKYAFYWRLKKELQTKRRFHGVPKTQIGFDKAMQLDTVLENTQHHETSSFM